MSKVETQPDTRPHAPELGNWICSAGPSNKAMNPVWGIAGIIVGIAICFAPLVRVPQPGEEAAVWGLFGTLGGLLCLAGLVMLVFPLLIPRQEIHLFEGGVVELLGRDRSKVTIAPWASIVEFRMNEWYESRFSKPSINASVVLDSGKRFGFSSTLVGSSDEIIKAIAEHVSNTKFIPFQP